MLAWRGAAAGVAAAPVLPPVAATAPLAAAAARRRRPVSIGTRMMSSESWPQLPWPLEASTPTTRSGTRPRRMVAPTGSASPNSSRRTVSPSTTTLPAELKSRALNGSPSAIRQSLTGK